MRNLILGASVGLAALVSAASAEAGTVYIRGAGNTAALSKNTVVIADFDGTNNGTFTPDATQGFTRYGTTSALALNNNAHDPSSVAAAVRRPVGTGSAFNQATHSFAAGTSSSNYAYVIGGATYTVSFKPAQVFSFVFGSLDAGNKLILNFAGGTSQTFIGGQLAGLASSTITSSTPREGRFFYDAQGVGGAAGSVISAIFTSSANSTFEFDSIATAAPEPAAWSMMILGFGLIGVTLRRKRPVRTMATA